MLKENTFHLSITSLSSDGRGIGHLDGLAVFCENSLPGQIVEATVTKRKKNYIEARTIRVIKESEDQVSPICQHFTQCGGCPWQSLDYTMQIKWKEDIVKNALLRIGQLNDLDLRNIVPSPINTRFRNKMRYFFGANGEKIVLGQYARGSHRAFDIISCPVFTFDATPIVEFARDFANKSKLPAKSDDKSNGYWAELILHAPRKGGCYVDIVVDTSKANEKKAHLMLAEILKNFPYVKGGVVSLYNGNRSLISQGGHVLCSEGELFIKETMKRDLKFFQEGTVADVDFSYSYDSFAQVNTYVAEIMYNYVAELLNCISIDILLDLYCGAGGFGIFLAPLAKLSYGIEISNNAVACAQMNAKTNKSDNACFIQGDASLLPLKMKKKMTYSSSVILVDPPRAGLSEKTIDNILRASPMHLIYVSCNPATLARDLSKFNSVYQTTSIQPFDLFPHTPHVEIVAMLMRRQI